MADARKLLDRTMRRLIQADAATRTAAISAEANARAQALAAEASARSAAMNDVSAALALRPRKFAATFGNGVLTSFTFTHNLGTADVMVQFFAASTGLIVSPVSVTRTANTVVAVFALAVGTNANRVVIIG